MKHQKELAIVGTITVAAILLVWIRRGLIEAGGENTKAVTSTATAGQAQTVITRTSPIQPSRIAVAAPESALELLVRASTQTLRQIGSLVLPSTGDRLQRFGNPVSAAAASNAPLRPQYKAKIWASSAITDAAN